MSHSLSLIRQRSIRLLWRLLKRVIARRGDPRRQCDRLARARTRWRHFFFFFSSRRTNDRKLLARALLNCNRGRSERPSSRQRRESSDQFHPNHCHRAEHRTVANSRFFCRADVVKITMRGRARCRPLLPRHRQIPTVKFWCARAILNERRPFLFPLPPPPGPSCSGVRSPHPPSLCLFVLARPQRVKLVRGLRLIEPAFYV